MILWIYDKVGSKMRKLLAIIIAINVSGACTRSQNICFESTDESTGGFTNIKFELNADKTVSLLKVDQKVVEATDSGTGYMPSFYEVSGTWTEEGEKIKCYLKENKEYLLNTFFKKSFRTENLSLGLNNEIIFPKAIDTIYIFGYPCVRKKTH